MLAQAAMLVVFVLAEKIRRGAINLATAEQQTKVLLCLSIPEKCHSDDTVLETVLVERGKPLKR